MTDWLMIFAGGLLGSSHCIGMCGAFALALGSTRQHVVANLFRQATYSLGRVFTYSTGGAVAGYAGSRLIADMGTIVRVQALLSMTAGALLLFQGLASLGLLRVFKPKLHAGSCLGSSLFASLLRSTRLRSVFLGGVVNGLLPCGLVYAYLALAASSGNMFLGWTTMALFGLGTLPVMVLVGCGGSLLALTFRRHLFHFAAYCVVVLGVISLMRGIGFLPSFGPPAPESCPMCR